MHAGYFLLSAVLLSFLQCPTFSRLSLLVTVPLNAVAEVNQQPAFDLCTLTLLLFTLSLGLFILHSMCVCLFVCQAMWWNSGIWRFKIWQFKIMASEILEDSSLRNVPCLKLSNNCPFLPLVGRWFVLQVLWVLSSIRGDKVSPSPFALCGPPGKVIEEDVLVPEQESPQSSTPKRCFRSPLHWRERERENINEWTLTFVMQITNLFKTEKFDHLFSLPFSSSNVPFLL